jgi:hypothetical protein
LSFYPFAVESFFKIEKTSPSHGTHPIQAGWI